MSAPRVVQRKTASKDEAAAPERAPAFRMTRFIDSLTPQPGACACGGGCPRCRHDYPLHTQVEVSQPGDALEHEADRVAEQVLRMPQPDRPDKTEAHETSGLRLSRYASDSSAESSPEVPSIVQDVVGSPGEPLDPATRAFMEPRFGQDFSSVRVHSGAAAEQSAREVNASAYTVGHDIVFAPGHYTPHTPAGRRLLAHELTHVMQQEAAGLPALQRKAGIGAAAEPAQATPVWLQLYPWLEKLPNLREVIAHLDKIHANRHRIQALYRQLDRVGGSFFSEDVERATSLREQISALQSANIELGIRLPIDVIALLHEDVFPSAAAGKADIGKMALVEDLKRRRGYIEIEDANGLTADPDRMAVYLNPGWDVRVDPDGIHYKTLLQNESLNLLVVQTAIMEEYLRTYDEFVEQNPWVKVELAKRHLAEAKERALEPPPESEEEREIKEYLADRKRYALEIEQAYVEAGALPVAILSLFVIDGPVDLLLTVVPVGKLGKAGKLGKKLVGLFKDRRKAKLAAKEVAEFLDNLDQEAYVFLRLAERLPKAQRAAVKVLHAHGASGQLIKNLMLKVARDGTVDLRWIAEMVESRKIDVKFIERFTLYEAHPRWDILQKVITKSGKVLPEERGQLAKALKGFLGEESAIKLLKSAGREILETGYQYRR